jgi:hypothetical protein
MTVTARLMVYDGAGPDPLDEELAARFDAAGLTIETRVLPTFRSAGPFTWTALLIIPMTSFLEALTADATNHLMGALRGLVGRLVGRRGAADETHPLVLQDARTGLQILLEPDLSPSAYAALVELDLTRYRRGPLHYDRALKRWRSATDEAASAVTSPADDPSSQ